MQGITVSLILHDDFSYIRDALRSLLAHTDRPLMIQITVNQGAPAEVSALQSDFPQVRVHINPEPRGFAANHNAVLRVATTDYVALLNDDIQAAPHMLDILADYLDQHHSVGLVSPRVLNPDGTPQTMVFSDPSMLRMLYRISGLGHFTRAGTPLRQLIQRVGGQRLGGASLGRYAETQIVPVVVGVAMIVRRSAAQQAGGMDEDTRVYGEEVAWHWRLRQLGWQIALVADTSIIHYNTAQGLSGWKLAEHRKGMLNYFVRYRPRWQALIIRGAIIVLHAVRALAILPFNRAQAAAEWATVGMAWRFQPLPTRG